MSLRMSSMWHGSLSGHSANWYQELSRGLVKHNAHRAAHDPWLAAICVFSPFLNLLPSLTGAGRPN